MLSTGRERLIYKEIPYPPKNFGQVFLELQDYVRSEPEIDLAEDEMFLYFIPDDSSYRILAAASITGYPRELPLGIQFMDQENRLFQKVELTHLLSPQMEWQDLQTEVMKQLKGKGQSFRLEFKRVVDGQSTFRLLLSLDIFH